VPRKLGLFLDRDGILLAETGSYVWHLDQTTILYSVSALIEVAVRHSATVVIVTNQGGIGRKYYSPRQVEMLHLILEKMLFKPFGVKPYWLICPHHPVSSHCWCRKPATLLFERAIHRTGIITYRSVMIGDQARDMDAARQMGLLAFGLHPNQPVPGADLSFTTHMEAALALDQLWS
jgi:D-glycero-D-manno-heptose 1,7-bisphosphate phosphatase